MLVNPWVYDFKFHDFWVKPYGLLKISTLLKSAGFEIDFIDCLDRLAAYSPEEFKKSDSYGKGAYYCEEVEKPQQYKRVPRKYKRYGIPVENFKKELENMKRPDIILVTSGVTYTYDGVRLAADILKDKFQVPIVLGGIYATLCTEHARKHSGADHVWQGAVNNVFLALAGKLARTRIDPKQEAEFNELVPDYSLYKELNSVAVRFTNGCPFSCTYCASKSLYEGFYQRNALNVLNELDSYHKRGIKNIAFYDDALLYKNHYIKGILKEVIKRGYNFVFQPSNGLHAAYIDEEAAALMKQAGFTDIRVSLETTDYFMQKSTGGKVDNEIFKRAVENLKKAGFKGSEIGVYILAGLPGQTAESVLNDVRFVAKLGIKIKPAIYSPIPGTVDFMRIKPDIKAALNNEPLLQNEYYFLTINNDYSWEDNVRIKAEIDSINSAV
jgi:radical SAM superfamily enzyme YgiQ (UPF0313 family)